MSRTGKNPVDLPKGVKVDTTANKVSVEGPKGKLDLNIPHGVNVEFKDDKLTVTRISDAKQNRSNHGTIRSRLANMVVGVTDGHKKDLEIQGIGFRAQLQGKKIVFNLGFSHPVEFDVPDCVTATIPTQTSITIEGPDNVMVGQIAAKIRALKPVEPYKGKGIRYVGEFVRRKQGKSATK
ncbi:MAG: 50S ribosomal protein L6 [Candidatus Omnitrophica bacterium]|nr:50S ribosomal protein L6 [Candidatus Omnitrophota bacterium]